MKKIISLLLLCALLSSCTADMLLPTPPENDDTEARPDGIGHAEPPADPTVFDRGKGRVSISGITMDNPRTSLPFEGSRYEVSEDNIIKFYYPLLASDKDIAAASLTFEYDSRSTSGTFDLTGSSYVELADKDGERATFLLIGKRERGAIPIMQIYTDENAPIESKKEYVHARLIIDGVSYDMKIRGRGNASWHSFPKKSYRIKLDKGAELFGLTKNRDFTLTSNYADRSLIRNSVAHTIAASLDGLDFTSVHIPVDLYLGGEYLGVYTFSDKIEEGEGRLDFTDIPDDEPNRFGGLDIGFLLETGWDFDGENVYNRDYFDAEKVLRIYVKEPESEVANTPEFTYAKRYVLAAEKAIMEDDGWEELIDLDSWVDWFIATELTFNTESAFYRSCYLWKRAGGRLMLGPVWDFDMAFGNHWGDVRGYEAWCTTESTYEYISENWMNYLIGYDSFKSAVKERWNEKKDDLLDTAMSAINTYSTKLGISQVQNFILWDEIETPINFSFASAYRFPTYEAQVEYLRKFITDRWNYMDNRINEEF